MDAAALKAFEDRAASLEQRMAALEIKDANKAAGEPIL